MITPSFGLTATERVLPKLALDFTTASLDNRVTFTRTTDATHPATYVNSSGYVATATDNQPRFDYDPVTLACKGLLIEESRTNLFLYSEQFNQAGTWGSSGVTITANRTTSPANDFFADEFKMNATTGTHFMRQIFTATATAFTFSLYVKAGTLQYIQFAENTNANIYANFDVSTGVVGTVGSSSTATIADAGNGWYRCTMTATLTAGSNYIYVLGAPSSSATRIPSWTAVGTELLYVYGSQIEAGAFATSYIPTTLLPLTRNADVATMTGTNFSDWYNDTAGTFVVDATTFATSFAATRYFMDASSKMSIGCNPAYRGGAPVTITLSGTNATNVASKIGLSGDAAGYALAYNGNAPSTNATALVSGATALNIGALNTLNNNSFIDGHIRKLSYWPQKLTNAELQAFTK